MCGVIRSLIFIIKKTISHLGETGFMPVLPVDPALKLRFSTLIQNNVSNNPFVNNIDGRLCIHCINILTRGQVTK